MYFTAPTGRRMYTLKKTAPDGSPTKSAHPGALLEDGRNTTLLRDPTFLHQSPPIPTLARALTINSPLFT